MPPSGVTMAVVNEESHKGEDAHSCLEHGDVLAYGVFDGHGGKHCSQGIANVSGGLSGVLPMILTDGRAALPEDEVIADAFWTADAQLGAWMLGQPDKSHAGSTATVLFVAEGATSAERSCLLAWVGDSTAVAVDMHGEGALAHVTRNHSPDVEEEIVFLEYLSAVAKLIRRKRKKADGGSGADDDDDDGKGAYLEEPPSTDEVVAATVEVGKQGQPLPAPPLGAAGTLVGLVHRALCREKVIMAHIPKGGKYRRNVCVYRRPVEKDANQPFAIATTMDPYSSHHRDLQMTRSICDWTKTSWITPQPEVLRFVVGSHTRVVLASDGLWDVTPHELALQIVRGAATCSDAADLLLAHAHRVYCEERGLERPGDDTTVMVVDINPTGTDFAPPPNRQETESGGCCAVS